MSDQKDMEEMVKRRCHELSEHFDTVRIFVTRHRGEDATTEGYSSGVGNFYAQRGQISEWLVKQDEFERLDAKESREE